MVTNAPDFDPNVSYEDEDKGEKDTRNTNGDEKLNEALDYNESTDSDIDTDVLSSSSPKTDQEPKCRGDDSIRDCPNYPQQKICESQLCDGVNDCPSGEDEDPELCRRGEALNEKKIFLKKLTFERTNNLKRFKAFSKKKLISIFFIQNYNLKKKLQLFYIFYLKFNENPKKNSRNLTNKIENVM